MFTATLKEEEKLSMELAAVAGWPWEMFPN